MEVVRQKNVASYIVFPIVDADGDAVTGAASLDSEIDAWADGSAPDGFTDCTNEATEIGSTGMYYLSLTNTELNVDYAIVQVKTATAGAKTQVILIRTMVGDPLNMAVTDDGTAINVASGIVEAQVKSIDANAITATSIASDAITAAKIAADAITAAKVASDVSAEIADAVWDEDATGHQTTGTFGQAIGDPVADTNTIFKAVVTDAAGATVGVDVVAVKAETADILTDTAEIGTAGAGLTNINLPNQTMDIVGNITGNLSGSVGSVTGAVGSVTGAVGSVTGNVGGNVTGSVGSVATGGIAAASFAAGAIDAAAIAANAIGSSELADGAITAAKFGAGAIDATAIATGAIDADALAADAITAAKVAADVTTELQSGLATAANLTTLTNYVDTEVASILAAVDTEVAAIKAKTDQLTFTVANTVDSNVEAVDGSATGVDKLAAHLPTVLKVIVGVGSTTTSIVLNATTGINGAAPSAVNDFYVGRVLVFTSGALAGQATSVTDYVGATVTLTVVALTAGPAAADTAVIV